MDSKLTFRDFQTDGFFETESVTNLKLTFFSLFFISGEDLVSKSPIQVQEAHEDWTRRHDVGRPGRRGRRRSTFARRISAAGRIAHDGPYADLSGANVPGFGRRRRRRNRTAQQPQPKRAKPTATSTIRRPTTAATTAFTPAFALVRSVSATTDPEPARGYVPARVERESARHDRRHRRRRRRWRRRLASTSGSFSAASFAPSLPRLAESSPTTAGHQTAADEPARDAAAVLVVPNHR